MTGKRPGLRARSDAVKAALAADHGADAPPGAEEAAPPSPPPTPAPLERAKPVGLSVRLPPEIHEELRTVAFERRVSIHALLMEGVDAVLKKYGRK